MTMLTFPNQSPYYMYLRPAHKKGDLDIRPELGYRAIEKYVNFINVTGARILHFGGYVNMEEHIRSPCPARIYHKPRSNGKRWI